MNVDVKPVNFVRVFKAEWIKSVSLKSTWITLGLTFAAIIAFGLLSSAVFAGEFGGEATPPQEVLSIIDSMDIVLSGAAMALLIIGVMGALMGAREYSSGLIRQTMAAVPKRSTVLLGKASVFILQTIPVIFLSFLIVFFAGMSILDSGGLPSREIADDRVLLLLVGNTLYLVGVGVIGLSLGFILKNIAGSIATLFGLVLVIPPLLTLVLPRDWDKVANYLPSNAAEAFTVYAGGDLGLTAGILTFAAWVAVLFALALILLKARDV